MLKSAIFAALVCAAVVPAKAASPVSANDLSDACQKVLKAVDDKGKWSGKKPDEIYASGQCAGFIEGWIDAIDGSIRVTNGVPVLVTVQRDKIKSYWDVATALVDHLSKTPLDKGKEADEVLAGILIGSNLIVTTAYHPPSTLENTSTQVQ